ncbi:hypothetical protein BZA70DRAFT_3042 [Myxozyma melibiosi]|uniref:RING-type domain-containing protein n=1 Tax=Myxozyma melibiosi TaxID=54550 RepID=A0ABR1FB40_9ASCO
MSSETQHYAGDADGTDRHSDGPTHSPPILFLCHSCYNEFNMTDPEFPVLCPRCDSEFCEMLEEEDEGDAESEEEYDDDDGYMLFGGGNGPQSFMEIMDRLSGNAGTINLGAALSGADGHNGNRGAMPTSDNDPERRYSLNSLLELVSPSEITRTNPRANATMWDNFLRHGVPGVPEPMPDSPTSSTSQTEPGGNQRQTRSSAQSDRTRQTSGDREEHGSSDEDQSEEELSNRDQWIHFLQNSLAGLTGEARLGGTRGAQVNPNAANDLVSMLMTQMFNMPGNPGDYVSDRQLDQIISQLMEQAPTTNAAPPAAQEEIQALPNISVKEHAEEIAKTPDCPLCMEAYTDTDMIKILPCKHFFHPPCITQWLVVSDSCPLCRTPINPEHAVPKGSSAPPREQAQEVDELPDVE